MAAVRKEIEAGYELTKWRSREMDPLLVFISALEVIIALQDQMEMVTKKDLLWFVMLFCIRVTPRTVLKNGVHSAMTKHFFQLFLKNGPRQTDSDSNGESLRLKEEKVVPLRRQDLSE